MIKQIQTVEEYQPVPVKAAKEIAEKYDKAIVIINTWDTKHGLLHTTTYGVSQEQKHQAAKGGDISAKALGADMPRSNFYEDFRKNELAQAQQEAVERAVYVLTAYDTEKERNGEVIVVDNREQAFEIEKTLQSIYGARNVMFSSRKINDIPVVILEALQKEDK